MSKKAVKKPEPSVDAVKAESFENNIINGLGDLVGLLGVGGLYDGPTSPLSSTSTLYYDTNPSMISNNRTILSYIYAKHGIVQTLVDQPVDDGFRAGFQIKSSNLSTDDIEKLQVFIEQERVIESVMQGMKWARLFGGGGTIIATDQDPSQPLNIAAIKEDSPLAFIPFDLWEVAFGMPNIYNPSVYLMTPDFNAPVYNYYGVQVDASRVMPARGKMPPSFLRPRFLGWGMSVVESLIRSINQYLKNQDVIFELLDEAKVDVYKIKRFTESLMTDGGTQKVAKRIQQANLMKNYNNALTMDSEDDYDQKQMAFTGLAEMLEQIRIQIAGDVKMPVTKLFGISSAGFNSGEDDIENYNSMIEGEIRSKSRFMVVDALKLCCQKLFGVVPDDLQIIWNPLRILSAEQEEKVKDSQFKRILDSYNSGLCSEQEAREAINKENLLGVEIDETAETDLQLEEDDFATPNEEKP